MSYGVVGSSNCGPFPAAGGGLFSNTGMILVLFILLVIITRAGWF